jgi:hypothetical protein
MKKCSYCGAEYPDDAVMCAVDETPFDLSGGPPPSPENGPAQYDLAPLSETDRQKDLVTLVSCPTLVAADTIACALRAAGIEVFMPDEFLMQAVGWNFNTYGYVRVQVSPKDYEAARNLLTETKHAT